MLEHITIVLPTILAILSLIMFNRNTRWFCYVLVSLSVVAELIPAQYNTTALAATVTALIALVIMDIVKHGHIHKPHLAHNK